MNAGDLTVLLPIIVLGATVVILMTAISFYRRHALTAALAASGQIIALAMIPVISPLAPRKVTPLIIVDSYSLFYAGLIISAGLAVTLLNYIYLREKKGRHDESYLLLLLAVLGSIVLVMSSHFASFVLGLEVLSVSLYSLIAYQRTKRGVKAGLMYLILAAVSTMFLLLGMALIYAELGTMEFSQIAGNISAADQRGLVIAGLALIIIGMGFKLALVPFHIWTPDVYEGAPAPMTAFIATVSKGAVFALLLRYFSQVGINNFPALSVMFTAIAVASMLTGNLLALFEDNVKRILAYSSIAHMGYLLVAFQSAGNLVVTAVSYYLVAYFVTTLGAFGIVALLSGPSGEADSLENYKGMGWSRPFTAAAFTAMLLSLAGIPLTAGFLGKFYIVAAGARSAIWTQLIVLVISSIIGLFYYLRIINVLYAQTPTGVSLPVTAPRISLMGGTILAVLTLLLIWLGVYPSPLIRLIQGMSLYQ